MQPQQVVRTTVFLVDLGDFAKVNAIYAETLAMALSRRGLCSVAALPKGAKVEIDCIAVLG